MRFYIFSLLFLLPFVNGCGKQNDLALGTLERQRIVHNATAAEVIVELPVAEGTLVHQGDVLVRLDDRRQQANLSLAEAQLQKAQARWDELHTGARSEDIAAARAGLAGAQASLVAAEKSYARALKLRDDKLTSQAEFDRVLAERESARAQQRTAEERLLVLTNGVREEVLRQAEADINIAQAQLELATIALRDLSVKATRDGYLDSLPWHLGERVSVGTPVAVVLADSAPYARVYIPETWRAKVTVGSPYTMRLDGVEKSYQAKLRWVADEPAFSPYFALNAAERGRLVFLAELDVDAAAELPSGMPVQVYLQAP